MDDSAPPTYHPDQLLILCDLLLPDDPSLREDVRLAIEEPDTYCARFQQRRLEGGIFLGDSYDPTWPDLPWFGVLDGLMARGRLVELDWKAAPEEVMEAIDYLRRDQSLTPDRWAWVDVERWHNTYTDSFLRAIGAWLLRHGDVLACFALGSDSYPLTILAEPSFREIQQVAVRTGYGGVVACADGNTF